MNTPRLQSFRLKNFKAVQDSGTITFTPLTVFIGNNGSGKSSILEGLEMLYTLVTSDLDTAIVPWRDFRYILNQAVPHEPKTKTVPRVRHYSANHMNFELRGQLEDKINGIYTLNVTDTPNGDELFIKQEILRQTGRNVPFINFKRDDTGLVTGKYVIDTVEETIETKLQDGISLLNLSPSPFAYDLPLRTFIRNWQFVSLVPQKMGEPRRQRRATSRITLEKDGSNVAEYLLDIQKRDRDAFDGIVSTLQQILPFSQDLQMALTSELDRSIYPQITEGNFKVPGWLLSTGTLRILALLALLRHPEPPPLIIIEEIENGLDPSSVHLIVNEILEAVESSRTQIILTTHSPYLLDLLSLDHIVLFKRVEGQP